MQNKNLIGVVLMTYGSATTAENVPDYFKEIYGDKVSADLIQDFEHRYRLVGHSPLVEITEKQAALLEEKLGDGYIVRAGMRHRAPSIEGAVAACKAREVKKIMGIILSPQFSSFIMEGYRTAFMDAARAHGFNDADVTLADPWPTEPHFIELLAKSIKESLAALHKKYPAQIPILFTTHSLPQRVVEKDPHYLDQLKATIDAVLKKSDEPWEWYAGYQSAGHTPEKWLTPDLTDILATLAPRNIPAVLIVPIQFLADHLEVLYDLDIAARKQCEERSIAYHRINLPNTDSLFIEALASIVLSYE